MVFSLFTCHDIFNIYHGNIRTSNFLINRYHYLYLTDFASYKPMYILQNTDQGLSEFRLYYASSVEKCYLAPEKLIDQESQLQFQAVYSKNLFNFNVKDSDKSQTDKSQTNMSTAAGSESNTAKKIKRNISLDEGDSSRHMSKLKMMDMFSLGLTILEVLNDGRSPMSYSDLLRMRKNGMDFDLLIKDSVSKLSSGSVVMAEILTSLLGVIPEDRMDATKCLRKVSRIIDQEMYLLLWMCLSAFSKSSFSSCDLRIKLIFVLIDFIEQEVRQSSHKWTSQPPRCLEGFNALKIFVELIEKHNIFSPKIEGGGKIFDRLFSHFEKEEKVEGTPVKEEIIFE